MERVCIYPKEAARILSKTERQTQRIFREIRKEFHKKKHQPVTIKEFAEHTGIPEAEIHLRLGKA